MTALHDIIWLAGLLEGEGCFRTMSGSTTPRIDLGMTDHDVVAKAHRTLGEHGKVLKCIGVNKPVFKICLTGFHAAGWMMTLYPLLGGRRQKRIRSILKAWRKAPWKRRNLGVPAKIPGTRNANPEYARLYRRA